MTKKINKSLAAVILASGSSTRTKSEVPKQYFSINNRSLVEINIIKFSSFSFINTLVVVVNKDHKTYYKNLKSKYKKVKFIIGSDSRQKSAFNALKHLRKLSLTYVFIHDAARPFTSKKLINLLYKKILVYKTGVIPVIKPLDSIKFCENNTIIDNLNREKIFLAQTPQLFDFSILYEVYIKNKKNLSTFTDDSQIFYASNQKIFTVKGEPENLKITTKEQWLKEKSMRKKYTIKVGQGFDTHKLVKGKYIILFGIKIANKFSLLGHSDADVGIHALIDALLGSSSLGDIGTHFPDTKNKFKGISSLILLDKVNSILEKNKIEISHIDCTLVAEKPKVSKYVLQMRKVLAKTLKINIENISIKATTTEGLGFTGREEGISCYSLVTIKKYMDND